MFKTYSANINFPICPNICLIRNIPIPFHLTRVGFFDFIELAVLDFIKSDTEVEISILVFLDFIKSDTEAVSILLFLGFTKSETEVEVLTLLFLCFTKSDTELKVSILLFLLFILYFMK